MHLKLHHVILPLLICSFNVHAQWIPISNQNTANSTCCFTEELGVVVAGGSNGMYWSTNYGDNWHISNTGINLPTEIISMGEHPSGFFAGTSKAIYYSSDIGITWLRVWPSNSIMIPTKDFAFIDHTVYAATLGSGIIKSSNTGLNWSSTFAGIPTTFIHSILRKGNLLLAGTESEGIFISSNAGQSWTASNMGLPSPITIQTLETDGTNVYAGSGLLNGSQGTATGMYVSSDDGASWAQVSNGLPTNEPIITIEPVGQALLTSTGKIYRSIDAGLSWSPFMGGIDTSCSQIVSGFIGTEDYVFCGIKDGCSGSVYRMYRDDLLATENEPLALKTLHVYPNPIIANDPLSVSNPLNEEVTLHLYDAQGRLVKQQHIGSKQLGQLSTTDLNKGMYHLRLNGTLEHYSEKVIVN